MPPNKKGVKKRQAEKKETVSFDDKNAKVGDTRPAIPSPSDATPPEQNELAEVDGDALLQMYGYSGIQYLADATNALGNMVVTLVEQVGKSWPGAIRDLLEADYRDVENNVFLAHYNETLRVVKESDKNMSEEGALAVMEKMLKYLYTAKHFDRMVKELGVRRAGGEKE